MKKNLVYLAQRQFKKPLHISVWLTDSFTTDNRTPIFTYIHGILQSENPIGENLLFLKKDECVRAKSGFPFPETAAKEIGLAAVLFRMHRKLGVKCLCDKKYRTES